jgi:D-alanyl-D-alanine carboxypeptidase
MHRTSTIFAVAWACLLLTAAAGPLSGQRLNPSRVATSLDSLAAELRTGGRPPGLTVLVAEGPQVVFVKGYGHADLSHDVLATPVTVYNVGSLTKQFLVAAILRLVEEGKLRLDDDLRTHIPEFPTHGQRVTLHHLLSSTSGIPRASNPPERSSERIDYSREEALATLISQYREKPFDFAPGEAWMYQNVNFLLLGFIVEKITGQSMWSYFREQIFAPLDMTATDRCDPEMVMKHRGIVKCCGLG